MKARMLAIALGLAALGLAASGPADPALADDNGTPEQQRDCTNDALTYCGQHIFAPDRNTRIGDCLWQHRTQISRECRVHLRPPRSDARQR